MDEIITLDYGSGGKKTSRLIEQYILPGFSNPALDVLGDGALIPGSGTLAFSTDSFVVDPIFFPGGDIGKLAVCGTVNDIAMCGAEPKFLSCALIIEEGLPMQTLERVLQSMRDAAAKAGVQIVTGDTKVVDRGRGDKLYINTAGIGYQKHVLPGLAAVRPGDAVLVSGTVGDHGTSVMLARSGMMEGEIRSDCAAELRWMSRLAPYLKTARLVVVHSGIDESQGAEWELATPLERMIAGRETPCGPFALDVVCGHTPAAMVAEKVTGDGSVEGVWWDGASHFYVDGATAYTHRLPTLVCDEAEGRHLELDGCGRPREIASAARR